MYFLKSVITFIVAVVVEQQRLIRTVSGCIAQVWTRSCILVCCMVTAWLDGMTGRLGAVELFGFLVGRHSVTVSCLYSGGCTQA